MSVPKVEPRPLNRSLSEVAADILHDYQDKPSFYAARPYVFALLSCNTTELGDMYMEESCADIVRGLLVNISNWRGTVAKRVKEELRAALAAHDAGRGQK